MGLNASMKQKWIKAVMALNKVQPSLGMWLKAAGLEQISDALKESEFETLQDVKDLENVHEIEEFADEMELETQTKKKLVKAVMALNEIEPSQNEDDDNKKDKDNKANDDD